MSDDQVPQIPETNGGEVGAPPPPPELPPSPPPVGDAPAPAPAGRYAKADLGKRFVAALIDGILAGVVGVVPVLGGLIGAAYMLLRDGLEIEFMDGRSLGKKIMKLRPVRLDGQPMDITASVKRNIPFAIGPLIMIIPIVGWVLGPVVAMVIGLVEAVLVLADPQGRRLGDKLAETMVVETED